MTFTPPPSPDPAALKVVLLSHDLGCSHRQQVLWAELSGPLADGMRAEYRRVRQLTAETSVREQCEEAISSPEFRP